jgi:hypothetical protein
MPAGLSVEQARALIGSRVHLTYWVGKPRWLTETQGEVLGLFGEHSIEVSNKPMRLAGLGSSTTTTIVERARIETVEEVGR